VNIFACIERLTNFQNRKIRYFSVLFEMAEVNEFFDSLNRMEEIDEYENEVSSQLATKIDQLITSVEIYWNQDFTDIRFNKNLEIEL
jgi:hypothetical protein